MLLDRSALPNIRSNRNGVLGSHVAVITFSRIERRPPSRRISVPMSKLRFGRTGAGSNCMGPNICMYCSPYCPYVWGNCAGESRNRVQKKYATRAKTWRCEHLVPEDSFIIAPERQLLPYIVHNIAEQEAPNPSSGSALLRSFSSF